MSKMFRNFKYLLKSALISSFRHLSMTIMAATAVTITLVLVSIFSVAAINVNYITRNIEQNVTVRASIKKDVPASEYPKLAAQIEKFDNVNQVVFSSKDDELKLYSNHYDGEIDLFELYGGTKNPLHDVYIITLNKATLTNRDSLTTNLNQLKTEITNIGKFQKIDYGGDNIEKIINILSAIRWGGLMFSIGLSLLAILLISNTIKATIYARRDEIYIMRNVGASNTFIKIPFLLEGIIIGILGSIIPIVSIIFGYQYISDRIKEFGDTIAIIEPWPFMANVSIFIIAVGVIVGIIGSYLAISKHVRLKR